MNNRLTITDLKTFKGTKIWESAKSHGLQSIGAFKLKKAKQDFYLYPLDEWEQGHYSNVTLKANEMLMRYETITSAIGGFFPMIKVNIESGLVYFQDDIYSEEMVFDKRAMKPMWINLNKTVTILKN